MFDFKIGDKVCLITSPQDVMTVHSVFGQRLVECTWIGKEGKTHKHSFRPESLQLDDTPTNLPAEQKPGLLQIDENDEEDFLNF